MAESTAWRGAMVSTVSHSEHSEQGEQSEHGEHCEHREWRDSKLASYFLEDAVPWLMYWEVQCAIPGEALSVSRSFRLLPGGGVSEQTLPWG